MEWFPYLNTAGYDTKIQYFFYLGPQFYIIYIGQGRKMNLEACLSYQTLTAVILHWITGMNIEI